MTSRLLLPVFVVILLMIAMSTPTWAAQLYVSIDPDDESSPFNARYQKTVFIEYPEDGLIRDQISGRDWQVTGSADSSNPGVQNLMDQMNRNIHDSGSQAVVSDLDVSYDTRLRSFADHASIDHYVLLRANVSNHVIMNDPQRALFDLGWRGLGAQDGVVIDGVEINTPISILESRLPDTYGLLAGTAADEILLQRIINADSILERPMTDWYFQIDRLSAAGGSIHPYYYPSVRPDIIIISDWTLGEYLHGVRWLSGVENENQVTVMLDREYTIKSNQTAGSAGISVHGYGMLDMLDGVEVAISTPEPPNLYGYPKAGGHREAWPYPERELLPGIQEFDVFVAYGVAGLAGIAGVAFFLARRRSRKRQSTRHQ